MDPWSSEGMALAKFERSRDAAQDAAEQERLALDKVLEVKKRIRAFALEHHGDDTFSDHPIPQSLHDELNIALEAITKAQQTKEAASVLAQQARSEFNQTVINATTE